MLKPDEQSVKSADPEINSVDEMHANIFQAVEDNKYPVIFRGKGDIKAGGPELLPEEQNHDFGDLKKAFENSSKRSLFNIINILSKNANVKIPLVVEVGREGPVGYDSVIDYVRNKIVNLVDVNLIHPIIAGGKEGDYYAQACIEELSEVFRDGHMANLIYLKNVLTSDYCGVDVSTPERRSCILGQLRDSLMPSGVVVMSNFNNKIQPEDFEIAGLKVIFRKYDLGKVIFLAQK